MSCPVFSSGFTATSASLTRPSRREGLLAVPRHRARPAPSLQSEHESAVESVDALQEPTASPTTAHPPFPPLYCCHGNKNEHETTGDESLSATPFSPPNLRAFRPPSTPGAMTAHGFDSRRSNTTASPSRSTGRPRGGCRPRPWRARRRGAAIRPRPSASPSRRPRGDGIGEIGRSKASPAVRNDLGYVRARLHGLFFCSSKSTLAS